MPTQKQYFTEQCAGILLHGSQEDLRTTQQHTQPAMQDLTLTSRLSNLHIHDLSCKTYRMQKSRLSNLHTRHVMQDLECSSLGSQTCIRGLPFKTCNTALKLAYTYTQPVMQDLQRWSRGSQTWIGWTFWWSDCSGRRREAPWLWCRDRHPGRQLGTCGISWGGRGSHDQTRLELQW